MSLNFSILNPNLNPNVGFQVFLNSKLLSQWVFLIDTRRFYFVCKQQISIKIHSPVVRPDKRLPIGSHMNILLPIIQKKINSHWNDFFGDVLNYLPSHEACVGVKVIASCALCSFGIPVNAGIIIAGNAFANPMSKRSMFFTVTATNFTIIILLRGDFW